VGVRIDGRVDGEVQPRPEDVEFDNVLRRLLVCDEVRPRGRWLKFVSQEYAHLHRSTCAAGRGGS